MVILFKSEQQVQWLIVIPSITPFCSAFVAKLGDLSRFVLTTPISHLHGIQVSILVHRGYVGVEIILYKKFVHKEVDVDDSHNPFYHIVNIRNL